MAQTILYDTAATIMTRDVVSILPGDSVPQIAAKLSKHRISAAPVVDITGKLLGMVSEGDLMRSFGVRNAMRRAWWLDMLAEGEDLAPAFLEYIRLDNHKATDLMTRDVVTATEETPISEIADLLIKNGIKRVPILRGARIVGIVSRADIVGTLVTRPGT
jgi:CBS domain-containing protein